MKSYADWIFEIAERTLTQERTHPGTFPTVWPSDSPGTRFRYDRVTREGDELTFTRDDIPRSIKMQADRVLSLGLMFHAHPFVTR